MSTPNPGGCYAVAVVLLVASTTVVSLRLNVRRVKKTSLGLDDLFISIALLLSWALAIILIIGTARGTVGTHTRQDPVTRLIQVTWHENDIAMIAFISQMISIVTYAALKLSVLFLFRRIFVGRVFNLVSIAAIAVVAAWGVSFFFATLFQCGSNPAWLWASPRAVAQHCSIYKYIQLGHATSDVATDLIVLFIPIPIIWKLNMSTSQKLGLTFVFLLGYISTAAAVARVVFITQGLYLTTTGARDLRGEQTNVMVWGYVEAGVGVIAASLPTLRPILKLRMPESIVNSVRSKLSLNSDWSRGRSKSEDDDSYPGSQTYKSHDRCMYGNASSSTTTHVQSSNHDMSDFPDDRILMQNGFVVDKDRAEESKV